MSPACTRRPPRSQHAIPSSNPHIGGIWPFVSSISTPNISHPLDVPFGGSALPRLGHATWSSTSWCNDIGVDPRAWHVCRVPTLEHDVCVVCDEATCAHVDAIPSQQDRRVSLRANTTQEHRKCRATVSIFVFVFLLSCFHCKQYTKPLLTMLPPFAPATN